MGLADGVDVWKKGREEESRMTPVFLAQVTEHWRSQ